jgi:hypothetical protein
MSFFWPKQKEVFGAQPARGSRHARKTKEVCPSQEPHRASHRDLEAHDPRAARRDV